MLIDQKLEEFRKFELELFWMLRFFEMLSNEKFSKNVLWDGGCDLQV